MKIKHCIDCMEAFPANRTKKRCDPCQAVESGLHNAHQGAGQGRMLRRGGRELVLTGKAVEGVELAQRNMWRRALGLPEWGYGGEEGKD